MKLRFIFRAVVIALCSSGWSVALSVTTPAAPPSPRIAEEDIKYLTVMIDATLKEEQVRGAGIIFGVDANNLYIATADHVVRWSADEAQEIQVQFRSLPGKRIRAILMPQHDSELDLAVLRVTGLAELGINIEALPFDRLGTPQSLTRGAQIYMLGYPGGKKWWINTTPERFAESEGDWIRFESRLITGGNSGGPLLDENRDLIGMVRSDQPPNGEAVSIARVMAKLRAWRYPVGLGELDSSPIKFAAVSVGDYRVCGITTSGTTYCWGRIGTYTVQTNVGSQIFSARPVRVRGGLTFKTISVGSAYASGVTTDGTGYWWGLNPFGKFGDGSIWTSFDPQPVPGQLTFQSLSVSERDTCGVTSDGKVYCWGGGGLEPQLMPGSAGFGSVSVHSGLSFGITKSGAAYLLFDDRAERHTTATPLTAVGGNCSIGADGAAYCWNRDGAPQLLKVPNAEGPFLPSVSGSFSRSCAVEKSGAIYCWQNSKSTPGTYHGGPGKWSAPGGRAFRSVGVGDTLACGITVDSALYCWGILLNYHRDVHKDYGAAPVLITRK